MKQISIHIPDAQLSFMMELLRKFDFVKIDVPAADTNFELTEEQKNLVEAERQRCKKDPDYLLDWEKVKNTFKV